MKKVLGAFALVLVLVGAAVLNGGAYAIKEAQGAYHFSGFLGTPPIHVLRSAQKAPAGLTPLEVKRIYNLPSRAAQAAR